MTSSIQYQATLEVLRRKKAELESQLIQGAAQREALHRDMEAEKADVTRLESDSFIVSLLKLLNLHEGRLTKESEEYLKAKLDYERKCFEVEEAEGQLTVLDRRIRETEVAQSAYQKTLTTKLAAFEALPKDAPQRAVYQKLTEKEMKLKAECVELEEALDACRRAIDTKDAAMVLLKSADSWATWDAFAGGGLLTDMIKYEKIEAVQNAFKSLSADLAHLGRELADVDESASLERINIDSTTKVFDIWFDNIFTDFKVKAQIQSQIEALHLLEGQLSSLRLSLESRQEVAEGGLKACIQALEDTLMA